MFYPRAMLLGRISARTFSNEHARVRDSSIHRYKYLLFQVSDGVIAPGYTDEALEILRKKKGGNYCVLTMDPTYEPTLMEKRTLYGLHLEQRRNDAIINEGVCYVIIREKRFHYRGGIALVFSALLRF